MSLSIEFIQARQILDSLGNGNSTERLRYRAERCLGRCIITRESATH